MMLDMMRGHDMEEVVCPLKSLMFTEICLCFKRKIKTDQEESEGSVRPWHIYTHELSLATPKKTYCAQVPESLILGWGCPEN